MRVRAIVVTVVAAVAAGMTEIDVLEFRADDGNWPNTGNRLPRKMVPGVAIEGVVAITRVARKIGVAPHRRFAEAAPHIKSQKVLRKGRRRRSARAGSKPPH